MPVDKSRYPTSWPKVSRTIRRIAGNRCEWCGIENGVLFIRGEKAKLLQEGKQTLPVTSKVPMTPLEKCVVDGGAVLHVLP